MEEDAFEQQMRTKLSLGQLLLKPLEIPLEIINVKFENLILHIFNLQRRLLKGEGGHF